MLTQYQLTLTPSAPCCPTPEWAYRLYAALLESAPSDFASAAHEDRTTPVSQFLTVKDDQLRWTVNLLGQTSEQILSPVLEDRECFSLRGGTTLKVTGRSVDTIRDADAVFLRSSSTGRHHLTFQTPTAFKSQGQYVNLPTSRLIVQSLLKSWNGCITECPIEDEDGDGLEALSHGLELRHFALFDQSYRLKGRMIPGFTGSLIVENRCKGFHRELLDALLFFSGFAGVGIKTTLGMGGVLHRK